LTGLSGVISTKGNRDVVRLESKLAQLFPDHVAIAMPMARVGIYLVLKNLIRPGQKVILSPYTISDVVNMVLCAGGVPLFADIADDGSCNIDADELILTLQKEADVGAVLVTHFYGMMCDVSRIAAACQQKGVPLIEDAAQAFGAKVNDRQAGTFGRAGIFSFGMLKNVTSFVGGAVVTADHALAEAIRRELAEFPPISPALLLGRIGKAAAFDFATSRPVFDTGVFWLFRYAYLHGIEFFTNQLETDSHPVSYARFPDTYRHRLSDAQARIILPQFARVEDHIDERIEKAGIYYEGLKNIPELILPPPRRDRSHTYFYYAIQYAQRDKLARDMTRRCRDVQVSHHRNCADMTCFAAYRRDCSNAARAERDVIYLPTYPSYRHEEVRANIEAIRAFFREGNA
jgi:dTDP-4-amino-4,6-dideoxygalactose transaminase